VNPSSSAMKATVAAVNRGSLPSLLNIRPKVFKFSFFITVLLPFYRSPKKNPPGQFAQRDLEIVMILIRSAGRRIPLRVVGRRDGAPLRLREEGHAGFLISRHHGMIHPGSKTKQRERRLERIPADSFFVNGP